MREVEKPKVVAAPDALRGIAALGAALGSWMAFTYWRDSAVAEGLSTFVDFFLVIAGFIVARAYRDRLSENGGYRSFVKGRLLRLMPLHLFCLAAFVALEGPYRLDVLESVWDGAADLLAHAALLQIFTSIDGPGWNEPAWIIAAELQLSFLFAVLCALGIANSRIGRVAIALSICAVLYYLTTSGPDLTWRMEAIGRGFVGFMTGFLLHSIGCSERVSRLMRRLKRRSAASFEIGALTWLVFFTANADEQTRFAAPIVFAGVLLIFMRGQGTLALALGHPWIAKLSRLGYPILLTHFLLVAVMAAIEARVGSNVTTLFATAATPIYLIASVFLAEIAHQIVETPLQNHFKQQAAKRRAADTAQTDAEKAGGKPKTA